VLVTKKIRSEARAVVVKVSAGEFLQYLVTSPSAKACFSLADASTGEVILSDRVSPTLLSTATFMRLWPMVGDRPQREHAFILAMNFEGPGSVYTFQVQHRQENGAWHAPIDLDFEGSAGDGEYLYDFSIRAE
jgi:hypothetical protein